MQAVEELRGDKPMWGKRKLAWLIRRGGRCGLNLHHRPHLHQPDAARSSHAGPDLAPQARWPTLPPCRQALRQTPAQGPQVEMARPDRPIDTVFVNLAPARPSSTSPPTIRSPNGPSPASPAGLKASLPASFAMLTDPGVRHAYNEAFVAAEVRKFQPFFDSFFDQQRDACIRLEDNNLLVASAGSGKSATRVCKVANVLERQLYRPDEILLLAFNKSAADELKTGIAGQLHRGKRAGVPRHDVSPLGRGIIKEVEGRPPQLAEVPHI
ncbi:MULTISPECIES: UvrD-helicase domain-containing protein [unclassified Mesorhizobium]|uniref:UvrD-helicase domain-containing protein n=1 Tax=unclassified Mesorhizobium TaxID=325217 RepID=UPI001FE14A94|nr:MULTISPECIES: UvrD-helicase domain-containing protein [unclassified Mesorhizobium]